jgi:hypothetical protein
MQDETMAGKCQLNKLEKIKENEIKEFNTKARNIVTDAIK